MREAAFHVLQLLPRPFDVANHSSDGVWYFQSRVGIEEMCALLPEAESAAKRIDKALILKALGDLA